MPHTPSAKKRLRQNIKRRVHNRAVKSNMRGQIRRVREAIQAGDLEKARTEFRAATKKLDRAASRSVIHKNKAARTKSRLNHLIKAASA